MADVPVSELAVLAHEFNQIAFGSFPTRELAAEGNALFAQPENQEKIKAVQTELDAFNGEAKAQFEILQNNQPAVDIWKLLGQKMGFDPAELGEEDRAQVKMIATMMMGVPEELLDKPFVPDTEEVAAAKKLAFDTAKQELEAISDRAAPTALKLEETLSSILKQVLPEETFNSLAGQYFETDESVSAGFAANNAPTLAAAFTPRPQA